MNTTVQYRNLNKEPVILPFDGTLALCRSAINSLKATLADQGVSGDVTITDENGTVTTEKLEPKP